MSNLLELTDYFMSRIYEVDGMCKFSISYNLSTDKSYYEVLEAPASNIDVSQYVNATPELIEEKWIYLYNNGEYVLVDRFEEGIISQATLFSKSGDIILDELLIKQAADAALEYTKKDLTKLDSLMQDALYGKSTETI